MWSVCGCPQPAALTSTSPRVLMPGRSVRRPWLTGGRPSRGMSGVTTWPRVGRPSRAGSQWSVVRARSPDTSWPARSPRRPSLAASLGSCRPRLVRAEYWVCGWVMLLSRVAWGSALPVVATLPHPGDRQIGAGGGEEAPWRSLLASFLSTST